jgi:predicted nucleic acid-binding protein
MSRTYLLEANVIYAYLLRDWFITLAARGVLVRWSDQIEAEFVEVRRQKSEQQGLRAQQVVALVRPAVPDYRTVASARRINALTLPDPDDRHVLAAAIETGADVIVTGNLRDFPPASPAPHGIMILTPDQALCEIHDEDPERMVQAAADMRARMVAPPHSPEAWLARLETAGAKALADRLRPFASRL